MGVFADIYIEDGAKIPEEKRMEFEQRLVRLLTAGGMCSINRVSLFGKNIGLIRFPSMPDENGKYYGYNYFDDAGSEPAGFRHGGGFCSGKLGQRRQLFAAVAAYELQALYTEGTAIVLLQGNPVDEYPFVQWINFLFNEHFEEKNKNPWLVYESLRAKGQEKEYLEMINLVPFYKYQISRDSYFQVQCVVKGMDPILEKLNEECSNIDPDDISTGKKIVEMASQLRKYKEESDLPYEEQAKHLLDFLRTLYASDDWSEIGKHIRNEEMFYPSGFLFCLDIPVCIVKTIAETYNLDFWELWGSVREYVGQPAGERR